jgi:signal transduction histidine kinase
MAKSHWEELVEQHTAELARTVTELQREISLRQQAEELLHRHTRELSLLNHIGQVLSSTLDVDEVLVTLLNEVRHVLDIDSCSVWLVDQATGEMICRHAVGIQSEIARGWRLPPNKGISGWVVSQGKSVIVPNTEVDERHYDELDQQSGLTVRSMLSVPLKARGKTLGVINVVHSKVNRFTTSDMTLLELLATSAATAIDNARLVEALRDQAAELQKRNEELDAYAHTVAHDLKGPLGPMLGYAEMLEKDFDRISQTDLQEHLHAIAASTQKMSNIIEELLLLAEARQSQVKAQPLDMAHIVSEALKRLNPMIEEYEAQVYLPSTWPLTIGYGPWVEEVWVNYVSNAVKYGGQPPRVQLGVTVQPDCMVRFWVRDNGPGIPREVQARLFSPFTRLDQARARGHGLGLSIVRRIVEKLGGQVGVESESITNSGSVFSFTLPYAGAEEDLKQEVRYDKWTTVAESIRNSTTENVTSTLDQATVPPFEKVGIKPVRSPLQG